MLERKKGNLLQEDAEVLVNTVNTVGVMGKGIALQFKKAFPDNFHAYKMACDAGELEPGKVFGFTTNALHNPKFIMNFPTKKHWKGKSKLEYIESGLKSLVDEVRARHIRSIALPPLGCGHGGLDWQVVLPLIERAFAQIPDVEAVVFEPAGAPEPERMANRTERPKMTPGRAAVIGLMDHYTVPGYNYRLSLLEVQKLAYFMQEAGEPLGLQFQKGPYGPYADTLRHVLNRIEGHFITGFGDGRNQPDTPIRLLPDAANAATKILEEKEDMRIRFARVTDLIEGFETPLGMELLSSVHWVVCREDPTAREDSEAAVSSVQSWSERKRKLMKPDQIRAAWLRLREQRWF